MMINEKELEEREAAELAAHKFGRVEAVAPKDTHSAPFTADALPSDVETSGESVGQDSAGKSESQAEDSPLVPSEGAKGARTVFIERGPWTISLDSVMYVTRADDGGLIVATEVGGYILTPAEAEQYQSEFAEFIK